MIKVSFILGTRPEAIKLAPVICRFIECKFLKTEICSTGQHKEMLDQTLRAFNLAPDIDLALMTSNQTLGGFVASAIRAVEAYLIESRPSLVFIQGDTNTVLSAALAAFYLKIPVFHVEAGLRTGNKYSPFPEEMNRLLTSRLAEMHFAPTQRAFRNLVAEGIDPSSIHLTGNTSIDALNLIINKVNSDDLVQLMERIGVPYDNFMSKKIILITGHRRESFGQGFINICRAIEFLAEKYADYVFVYPVHLNPNVKQPVMQVLGDKKNVLLTDPINYVEFIALMGCAHIVVTDSGGIQEEAASLNKPLLIMRENTERQEGIEAGCALLVGTSEERIISNFCSLMDDTFKYASMINITNPYGDGKASDRIIEQTLKYLKIA